MLNQLLKFTLVSSVLLWLRPRWKSLLALLVVVVMVHILHAEYLNYVELSGNDSYLVSSFVLKWLALVAAVTVYVGYITLGAKNPARSKTQASSNDARAVAADVTPDDGFDFLRSKPHLESRADKVIASKETAAGGDR